MNAPKYGYHTLKVLLARSLYNAHTCPIHTIYIHIHRCKLGKNAKTAYIYMLKDCKAKKCKKLQAM